jgi:phospholipid/cholesterol/gamma-HCH transport system substrate-binding protein
VTAAAGLTRRRTSRLGGVRTWLGSRPGLARNVVIIIAAIIVGVTAAALILSQEELIFPGESTNTYYAIFSDASAVAPGQHQEVRVAGVHVGQIGSATVTSGGQAKLQLRITDTSLKVYANATALLQAKTPLNEMYVSLDPGSPAAPLMKNGQTIPIEQTQSPVEIDQILDHLGPNQQNAQRILLSETNIALTDASPSLAGDFSAIDGSLSSLQPVAVALQTRQRETRELVTDLDVIARAVGGNDQQLASLLDNAQTTLTTLSANDAALQKTLAALPGTTDAIGTSLGTVHKLSGQLNPFLDNLRSADATLPSSLSTLTATVNRLKPVVDELNPVINVGTPVIDNTKLLLNDANPALADLTQITPLLNPITSYLAYDTPWLEGFFFHTASLGSLSINTPNGREQVVRSLVGTGTTGLQSVDGTPLGTAICPIIQQAAASGPTIPDPNTPLPDSGAGALAGICPTGGK